MDFPHLVETSVRNENNEQLRTFFETPIDSHTEDFDFNFDSSKPLVVSLSSDAVSRTKRYWEGKIRKMRECAHSQQKRPIIRRDIKPIVDPYHRMTVEAIVNSRRVPKQQFIPVRTKLPPLRPVFV